MSAVGDLFKMLGSPFGLIGTIALTAFGIAHHFAAADLKNAAGRERLRDGVAGRRPLAAALYPAADPARSTGSTGFSATPIRRPSRCRRRFGNREAHPYWTGLVVRPLRTARAGLPAAEPVRRLGLDRRKRPDCRMAWDEAGGRVVVPRLIAMAATILMGFALWRLVALHRAGAASLGLLSLSLSLALSLSLSLALALALALSLALSLSLSLALSLPLAGAGRFRCRCLSLALLAFVRWRCRCAVAVDTCRILRAAQHPRLVLGSVLADSIVRSVMSV